MSTTRPGPPRHILATARRLLPALTNAVQHAAALATAAQRRLRPTDIRRKGVGDFVTSVDLRCERLLRRTLTPLLDDAGFLGEELPAQDLERDWLWVLDPIDGTSNFGRGLPHFAVSAALLWRSMPVLAVVHCQPEDATYTAVCGRGARRGSRRISATASRLDDAAIVGCQWHRGQQDMAFLSRLQQRGNRIRTFGSTVTQLVDVAMGRLDANVQEQGRVWDFAAAGLIVLEAGCRFTDWRGNDVLPIRDLAVEHTPTIASPRNIHKRLVDLLGQP